MCRVHFCAPCQPGCLDAHTPRSLLPRSCHVETGLGRPCYLLLEVPLLAAHPSDDHHAAHGWADDHRGTQGCVGGLAGHCRH